MKIEKMTNEELDNEYNKLINELKEKKDAKALFPPTSFLGTLYFETTISKLENKIIKIKNEKKKRASF